MGRFAPVEVHRVGIGEDQQGIGLDLARQQSGGEVFVDHCLNPAIAVGVFHHRHAAAAVADHQVVALDKRRDGVALNDALRLWRGHHAAEIAAVGPEHPAFLRGQRFCLRFAVDRADVLGRVAEGRVGGVHLHLSEQDAHLALGQAVFQRLLEHVADHPLAFRAENVQRIRGNFVVGAVLQRQQPDLRPVAVHQHHAPLRRQPGDGAGGKLNVLALDVGL